jgi:hypothetical protein
VVILVRHISGNLKSRFADFLTSDGEKPWEALHRSLAHTSYHVGQIVFIGKSLRAAEWQLFCDVPLTHRMWGLSFFAVMSNRPAVRPEARVRRGPSVRRGESAT